MAVKVSVFLLMLVSLLGFLVGFATIFYSPYEFAPDQEFNQQNYTYFFRRGVVDNRVLKSGWSQPEDWGVWSVGKRSEIGLPIHKSRIRFFRVTFSFKIFPGAGRKQDVIVYCNGKKVDVWSYKPVKDFDFRRLKVAVDETTPLDQIVFSFVISNPTSPKEMNLSADNRKLGLGMRQIDITTYGERPDVIIQ